MALRAYSFWIFDRHCEAIYYQDWSHLHQQGPASTASSFTSSISSTLQRVGGAQVDADKPAEAPVRARGDALDGVSRSVQADAGQADARLLPLDQEAKLIYGVVYSLRNMVRKLGGPTETFHNFSTSTYTLTHMQTPSMYTLVLVTDPPPTRTDKGPLAGLAGTSPIPGTNGMTLRGVLRELWRGPWAQHAAQHPLVHATEREAYGPTDARHARTRGIDHDALRDAIEQVLVQYKLLPP
ncbi:Trafficking protein particle complex subunit BET5 [Malassezia caprae]|uniref:Trafficking protein particle complex subunit n=1 Tax=Malassezia caprae TaxID=1381934 RepID=A0AAF0E4D1_9BASI|nr:Trafficking protein particle complex subunit BET5 [Malassezia caprae]